jgi:hypothetical protein
MSDRIGLNSAACSGVQHRPPCSKGPCALSKSPFHPSRFPTHRGHAMRRFEFCFSRNGQFPWLSAFPEITHLHCCSP